MPPNLDIASKRIASAVNEPRSDPITITMGILEFLSAALKCWNDLHPTEQTSSPKDFAVSKFNATTGTFDQAFVESQRGLQRRSARIGFRKAKRQKLVSGVFHPLTPDELDLRTIKSLTDAMNADDGFVAACRLEASQLPIDDDSGDTDE